MAGSVRPPRTLPDLGDTPAAPPAGAPAWAWDGTAWVPTAGLITGPGTVAFNPDGSVTETYGGLTVVTTFNPDGSVTQAYGPPVSKTRTVTFGPGGAVTETLA